MAQKKNKFNGTDWRLKLGTAANALKLITDELSVEFSQSSNMIDTGSKDDGADDTFILGSISRTIKFSGQLDTSTGETKAAFGDLRTWADAGTAIFFSVGSAATGEYVLTGGGKIANLNIKAERNNIAMIDFEIRVSGATAYTVNA